jgi:hypothetical protein
LADCSGAGVKSSDPCEGDAVADTGAGFVLGSASAAGRGVIAARQPPDPDSLLAVCRTVRGAGLTCRSRTITDVVATDDVGGVSGDAALSELGATTDEDWAAGVSMP